MHKQDVKSLKIMVNTKREKKTAQNIYILKNNRLKFTSRGKKECSPSQVEQVKRNNVEIEES